MTNKSFNVNRHGAIAALALAAALTLAGPVNVEAAGGGGGHSGGGGASPGAGRSIGASPGFTGNTSVFTPDGGGGRGMGGRGLGGVAAQGGWRGIQPRGPVALYPQPGQRNVGDNEGPYVPSREFLGTDSCLYRHRAGFRRFCPDAY